MAHQPPLQRGRRNHKMFTGIRIDPILTRSALASGCTPKCAAKTGGAKCDFCTATDKYMDMAFEGDYPSLVMVPTRIYETFFFSGPVNYFMLLMGYMIINDTIRRLCAVDSTFNKDARWNAAAKSSRQKIMADVATFRDRVNDKIASATSRLELVQAAEYSICVFLVAMEATEVGRKLAFSEARVNAMVQDMTTRSIQPWIHDRCGGDNLPEKKRADSMWNLEWTRRRGVRTLMADIAKMQERGAVVPSPPREVPVEEAATEQAN